jgi:hypothetical protein
LIIDAGKCAGQRKAPSRHASSRGRPANASFERLSTAAFKIGGSCGEPKAVSGYNPFVQTSISEETKMAEPTYEELKAKIAELEKKSVRTGEIDFKIGEKGGVSVYGLGRFPVTLYYEQWIKLLDASQKLRDFLEDNKGKLKLKEK